MGVNEYTPSVVRTERALESGPVDGSTAGTRIKRRARPGCRSGQPSFPTPKVGPRLSESVLAPALLARPSQESISRGATLAQRCAIYQGPTSTSRMLPGQYPSIIYKHLLDFPPGARSNAILTEQEIADLDA